MSDTERIDWLEKQQGSALVSDDFGHWAVVCDGVQNVPENSPDDIRTVFFIRQGQWLPSVRQAIDAAINEEQSHE